MNYGTSTTLPVFFRSSRWQFACPASSNENAVDVRTDPAFLDAAQDVGHPERNFPEFVPHVAEVQTKHAAISVEQRRRVKLGRPHDGFQHFDFGLRVRPPKQSRSQTSRDVQCVAKH